MSGNGSSIEADGSAETRSAGNRPDYRPELADGMDESEIFHILGNDRRREIICTLIDDTEALPVSDLARRIASAEVDDEPSKNLYKSVYVSLQQTHLPKLAEKGIVVYDTDAQRVEPGPAFQEMRAYLHGTTREVSPLQLAVPLSLSALGLLVTLGLTVRVSILQGIGDMVVSAIFVLLIVVLIASRFRARP